MNNNRFSRRDVLIMIFCILFATANICSVGKMGRENEKRMICASNIKQQLTALINFAKDNDGKLQPLGEGYWPCDIRTSTSRLLLEEMGTSISDIYPPGGGDIPVQDVFYCPSNIPQNKARNTYWHYSSGYRILGYFYLWATSWNNYGTTPIQGPGNKKWVSTIYTDNPSKTELVTDAVFCDSTGNFGKILCGGMGFGFYDSSSHLKTMKEPYGGNIGFVDGHVDWRPFNEMYDRFGYTCPRFWW